MVGSNIQQYAGGSRPPEKQRSQEQCKSHKGHVWMATGAKVSKMSQAYSHAVSHGDSAICAVNCTFKVISHGSLY